MKQVARIHLTFTIVITTFCLWTSLSGFAQNTAPVANDDTYSVGYNIARTIDSVQGLLINDTDANDPTGLFVHPNPVSDVSFGNLTLGMDGSFSYTPNTNYLGTDTFTYRVCDNGAPRTLVSQFDFDTATLTDATVGPNATSINPNAVQIECGLHIPKGFTGGNEGLDLVIPNTGGIFNFTSFEVAFEYRDQESQATLVEGGNFSLYHIRANDLGMALTVINGTTGLQQTYTLDLGPFLSGNNPYSITYNEITGEVIYDANGTITTFPVAPPFSPLDSSLATDVVVGEQLDNSGRDFASFCSMLLYDRSALCDTAVVTLNVRAKVISNRRITYRVKYN